MGRVISAFCAKAIRAVQLSGAGWIIVLWRVFTGLYLFVLSELELNTVFVSPLATLALVLCVAGETR